MSKFKKRFLKLRKNPEQTLWVYFGYLLAFGCSQQVMEEPRPVDSISHNEEAVDNYLQELISTEGRELTGFTESARWGRIEMVEEMISNGIPVDAKDEFGRTALILAASGGQIEIIRLLIEKGADVNFQEERSGATPMLTLLSTLHPEGVYYSAAELLINSGAKTDVVDKSGKSAQDWAHVRIAEGRLSENFIDEFLSKKNH